MFASLVFSPSANATTYNDANDFSLAGNPNGNWSYLYSGNLLATEVHATTGPLTGLDIWWTAQAIPNSVVVGKNTTNAPLTVSGTVVVPTNYLLMDPESYSNVDVRFTASSSGSYSITGGFLGIDIDERSHPVEILDNGVAVFSGIINGYGQSDAFNLTETLNAGDVLDFESLTGNTYTFLSTGLSVSISPSVSPEPQSYALMLAGLAAMGIGTLRKIRRRSE